MSDAVIRATGHTSGRGRGTLLLIVGLLMLPFIIGGALYVGGWQPARTVHHGHLVQPPRALPDAVLRASAELRGKWLLLLEVRGACTAECAGRLDEMRRIQVALYKNMGRLRRVVLTDRPDDPKLAALRQAQPDLLVIVAPPTGSADPLLLADPQGQLIMTYPSDATAQGVRADLERLLKFAWTG
jgi:hypothetical protein